LTVLSGEMFPKTGIIRLAPGVSSAFMNYWRG
jgi:hypothetical protein